MSKELENQKLNYVTQGDYCLPCIRTKEQTELHIGVWANRHRQHLKQHHRIKYYNLLTSERLYPYLADIEEQAEAMDNGKMFVPQNWIKSKASLKDIRGAIRNHLTTLKMMPNGKQILENLNNGLSMDKDNFEARWTAD